MGTLTKQAQACGGYSAPELQKLLKEQCSSSLQQRQENAQELIANTQAVLDKQGAAWQAAYAAIGQLLTQLSEAHDRHKQGHMALTTGIMKSLETTKQEFQSGNMAQETAFQDAVTAVQQAASEQELDGRVSASLGDLDSIEAGYRAYHATVLSLLRQHPHSVSTANAAYQQQLCSRVCVQDPVNTATLPATAVATGSGNAIGAVAQSVPTVAIDASAASTAAMAATPSQLQTPAATVVAAGVEFLAQLDLFRHYIEEPVGAAEATAEQKVAAAAKAVAAVKAEAAAAVLKAASEAAAAEAAAAEVAATAAAAAAAEAKNGKGGKDAKGKPAAAAPKAKEASTAADKVGKGGKKAAADKAVAEAAAAAADPPVAVFEFQYGGVKVPLDRQGAALCLEDSLPEVAIKQVLHTFQMQFLEDMVTFCEEAESSGRSWAGEEEVAATEELEARLRSHRPRAGRVEEEVRQARAVELIAQKRLLDLHMRSQGKALGMQQQEVAGAVAAAAEARRQWLAKLAGMEQLLYSAQSAKFLDIRKREAEAFKEKLGRDLAAQMVRLAETVTASSQKVLDLNTKFAEDHLKGFEQGGKYAAATVQQAQEQLQQVETAVVTIRQQQVSSAEAAKEETEKAAAAALEAVLAAVPRHRLDLTLLEALDKALESAKRLSQKRFSESNAAAGLITADIVKLQQLLQPRAADTNDLAFCKHVMEAAVALRAGLHTRAQVLQLAKTPIIACDPVDLSLLSQSLVTQATASSPVPAPVLANTIDSGTVSISAQIEAAVKACEAETARVGQDYYSALSASSLTAAKGPAAAKSSALAKGKSAKEEPPAPAEGGSTRPERIPATLTALQELNSKILQDLQQQLQDHLAASHKLLRAQVVTVYRLLELVPSLVTAAFTRHELVAAAAAQQALAAPIEQQHQQLLQQFDGHKKALQPGMAQPSRQSEVTALSSAEQECSAQAVQLGQGHTQAALQLVSLQGPAMRAKLVQLTQLLLRLLDGFVMPEDLSGSREDLREALTRGHSSGSVTMASSVTADLSSPQRRSLKQLQALALAAAEAGGEAIQGSPAGKAPAAGDKPAAAGKAASKGSAKVAAADSSRSYVACQWHLPPPLLTMQDLGWSATDTEALCPPPAQPASDAASAPKGKAAAAAKKPASAERKPPAATEGSMAEEIVGGFETPCHVAAVRGHHAAVLQLKEHLAASVAALKSTMSVWQKNVLANQERWADLLKSLNDAV
ncbi:TPA: hypothetical protein ACH3X1_012711 [Trebouxia sp. C0004]